MIDENGAAIYKQRNNGCYVLENGIKLDNRYVVPYNLSLIIHYQAHVIVEWCDKSRWSNIYLNMSTKI